MYTLENFATGRYDVRSENGARIGSIIGGKNSWCAEIGNRVLGYHPTTAAAAEAILKDSKIVGIFKQMCDIVRDALPMFDGFVDEFLDSDQRFIESWQCATDMIWTVRRSGTSLIALDLPSSFDEVMTMLAAYPDQTDNLYYIDVTTLKVKKVTRHFIKAKSAEREKYQIISSGVSGHDKADITCYGKLFARIELTPYIGDSLKNRCHVVIDSQLLPSSRELVVLRRIGFLLKRVSKRYSAPASICITHENKQIHQWVSEV